MRFCGYFAASPPLWTARLRGGLGPMNFVDGQGVPNVQLGTDLVSFCGCSAALSTVLSESEIDSMVDVLSEGLEVLRKN